MALVGFPENIKVVLGTAWSPGKNSLDDGDTLILSKVSGEEKWTEGGTDAPNEATNRLQFRPLHLVTGDPGMWAYVQPASGTIFLSGGFAVGFGSTQTNYTFAALWSGVPDSSGFTAAFSGGFVSAANVTYNPDIFSTLQAAVAGDLNILEGETAIPDGTSTPRDFGSIAIGGAAPQKTFTVENLGDTTVSITSITVPTGYEIDAGSGLDGGADTIAASASKTLVVNLLTAEAGTKSGDVTINSDDADEAAYNFAVTGVVAAAANGGMVTSMVGDLASDLIGGVVA